MIFGILRLPRLSLHGVLAGIGAAAVLAVLVTPAMLPDLFADATARHQAVEDSCQHDMGCWSERNLVAAQAACVPLVEERAPRGFKWTSDWLESIFFASHALAPGNWVLEYAGDSIRFRDTAGAWKSMSYYCSFDTKSHRITGVRIVAGDNPDN
jgi:hypothetical protein